MKRLIYDNDGVYMIDEECLRQKELKEKQKEMRWQHINNQSKDRNKNRRSQK